MTCVGALSGTAAWSDYVTARHPEFAIALTEINDGTTRTVLLTEQVCAVSAPK
jgi:hypothetical protein